MTTKEELLKHLEQIIQHQSMLDANIQALKEGVDRLNQSEQIRFGDIITTPDGRKRIALFSEDGSLIAFQYNGCRIDRIGVKDTYYKKTGFNLFDNDLILQRREL